jgi:hypothetical protein
MLAFERATHIGNDEGDEGEPAAAVFAGDSFEELPQRRRRGLAAMLLGSCGDGLREVVEDCRVERGQYPGGLKEVEETGLAFGSFSELSKTAEDLVARSDQAVDGVESAVIVRCLKDVVDDEEGLSVLAWGAGKTAIQFEVGIDRRRSEAEWVSHVVSGPFGEDCLIRPLWF